MDRRQGSHVAVLTFMIPSHAAPMLSIARWLATHSPATYFSFLGVKSSNAAALAPYAKAEVPMPPNVAVYDVWDGVPDGYAFTGKFHEHFDLFLTAAKGSFERGMQTAEEERGRKITCLLTDAFLWFGREIAAERGGIRWLPFWTAGCNSLTAHVYTDTLRETIGDVAGKEDEQLTIPGLTKIRVRDLPEGVVAGRLDSMFSEMLRRMGAEIFHADAVIVNSFEGFDRSCFENLKSEFKSYLAIGPLDLVTSAPKPPDTYGCLRWLDGRAPASVAYISFGTVVSPPPHEIAALAEALEENGAPFLWSLSESVTADLPEGFLKRTESRGLVVPWTPQASILSHEAVGLFLTHCGWNSIMESVAGGVPLICRPFFADQKMNARAVEEVWKIGVQVESGKLTKDGVLKSINEVNGNEMMKENVKSLHDQAKKATAPGGSSTENLSALVALASG